MKDITTATHHNRPARLALAALLFTALSTLMLGCAQIGGASSPEVSQAQGQVADRTNCDDILGTAFVSSTEQEWFAANCSHWPLINVPDPPAPGTAAPLPPVCDQMRGKAYTSEDQRQFYLATCLGGSTSTLNAPANPSAGDRQDCNAIRGTPYRSDTERSWYVTYCSGANSAPPAASSGPDRQDCNAIRGTAYRSDTERAWYAANCSASQPATATGSVVVAPSTQPQTQPQQQAPAADEGKKNNNGNGFGNGKR